MARYDYRCHRCGRFEILRPAPDADPPLALPPEPHNALLGSLDGQPPRRRPARPPAPRRRRENGGNQDIKNLTRGARIFLPVFVDGGKLSAGDLHFSQGDGEITFCGAIEMGGYLDLRIDLIKDRNVRPAASPATRCSCPGNVEPSYGESYTFVGESAIAEVAYEKAGNRVHSRIEPRPSHHGQSQHPGGGQAHVHLLQAPGQLADGGAQRLNLASVPEARAAAAPCRPPAGEAAPRSLG